MELGFYFEVTKEKLCIATAVLFEFEINDHFGTLRLPFIGQWVWYWRGFMRPCACMFEPWHLAKNGPTGLKY